MRKFIVWVFIIIVALFLADRLGGYIMDRVNRSTHDVIGPKMKYLAEDVNEDLVMLGASRCNLHYVPSILKDSLGISVYNGGVDGSNNVFAHYMSLNLVLSHHTPKIIGLEVMPQDFLDLPNSFDVVGFYAPYFGTTDRMDSVFRDAGTYWPYQISHLYRYNSKAVSNIAGLFVNRQSDTDAGYIPKPKPAVYPQLSDEVITSFKVDSLKLRYLKKFVDECRQKDIELFFVVSPKFTNPIPGQYDVLKKFAEKENVPFLDYHSSKTYHGHPEYFYDQSHLWDEGARKYSSLFARDLDSVFSITGRSYRHDNLH